MSRGFLLSASDPQGSHDESERHATKIRKRIMLALFIIIGGGWWVIQHFWGPTSPTPVPAASQPANR